MKQLVVDMHKKFGSPAGVDVILDKKVKQRLLKGGRVSFGGLDIVRHSIVIKTDLGKLWGFDFLLPSGRDGHLAVTVNAQTGLQEFSSNLFDINIHKELNSN